jgi:hypothetical protein
VSGGYSGAFLLFVAMALLSAFAIRITLPAEERARLVIGETAAA